VAEALELFDQAAAVAFGCFGVAAVEELIAELVVGDALVEDVVGGGEDLVGGRDRGFGVSAAALRSTTSAYLRSSSISWPRFCRKLPSAPASAAITVIA
jgi:hypothetical protein